MSDDRIFIRCHCGAERLVRKHYAGSGYNWFPETLGEWIEEHASCNPNYYQSDLEGETGFKLIAEDEWARPKRQVKIT